ncbi:type II toxin-antitoxin system PrlF family antitoxin [Methyloversatilis discipulorum]|uniref:type II toxin-antitoxin system PrlF family antitoxin n=1 Tax=Methyloversatilis discipulorum TaxID=1119528 RepID=UPI00036C49EF|nr:type II toxin-antitoxin system PrlF family antitoxin [Methyloversatilis discipulorum]
MIDDVDDEETAAISVVEKAVLDHLDRDIIVHPERLQPITAELVRSVQSLVSGVSVELDIQLPPDDG